MRSKDKAGRSCGWEQPPITHNDYQAFDGQETAVGQTERGDESFLGGQSGGWQDAFKKLSNYLAQHYIAYQT